mgnify:CR=1 FL=1
MKFFLTYGYPKKNFTDSLPLKGGSYDRRKT